MDALSYEYAGVYLLDSPYCIDGIYDYYVPIELRGQVIPGSFVAVPFGRGNRKQMAVVREMRHCPSYSDVKPIAEICESRPVVSEEVLLLCDYMKEQYLCTYGEAVRCTVPASVLGKMTEFYYPLPKKGPDASSGFTPADLFVYDHLCTTGGKSIDSLKAKFGSGATEQALSKLLSKGLVGKEIFTGKVMSDAFEDYYSLALERDSIISIIEGISEIKLRSEKQKAILSELVDSEAAVSAKYLTDKLDVGAPQFKTLVSKGLITLEKRRVWRQSYDNVKQDASEIVLNEEQSAAFETVKEHLLSDKAGAILLHGVTGSGKTSVIIRAIDEALSQNKGVVMLLPEIALTPQTLKIFKARFGDRIALIHSGLSAGERYDSYSRIKNGDADLVIGTRSAVFAPVKNPGLFIIDEEHETTYKSDTSPKYHARDIARWRCVHNDAVLLLASATPSIESYTKAVGGKYTLVKLRGRYGGAELPEVLVYDMRNEAKLENQSPIGLALQQEMRNVTERGEQAIIFLNRRGYNTSVGCKSCGETLKCPHCSISMNYHTKKGGYDKGFLFCHWCGYKTDLPQKCPSCGSEHLVKTGFGTQKIEQQISESFPDKKILRMDADSTSAKNSLDEILADFKDHRADILLGTQMVTKGHDFPDVTLVGVLLADMSLYMDDYHANERTFSMLTQVIGRAGRSKKKGMAIIQTNNPDNDTIKFACKQDYEAFYAAEIRLRKLLVFPPYCDIALLTLTCSDEKQVLISAKVLRQELNKLAAMDYKDVEMIIFGPFESPVYKVEEKYRMRIVVKFRINRRSRELFSRLLSDFGRNSKGKVALSIDFNPSGL